MERPFYGAREKVSLGPPIRFLAFLTLAVFMLPALACAESQRVIQNDGVAPVNGVEIYYKILGQGRPVFILHGGPGLEHSYLAPFFSRLAEDYKLIFYDQRAVGRSSGAADEFSITVENYVKDLDGLREFLGYEKINLLGHSWGGLLALFYALSYPGHVNSLALVGSAGASSDFWDPFSQAVDARRTAEDDRELMNLSGPETTSLRDEILFRSYFYDRERAKDLKLSYTERTTRNSQPINSLMYGRALSFYDIHSELGRIDKPVIVIHGDFDPVPLSVADKIHQAIRGSQLAVLENCGHFPFIECPEEFFDKLRAFLRSIPPDAIS